MCAYLKDCWNFTPALCVISGIYYNDRSAPFEIKTITRSISDFKGDLYS